MSRILVIDDDDLVRDTLVRILTRAGHDAIGAKDGRDGVKQFQLQPPDLIVTDVIMPEQDGIETVLQLRRSDATLPIIAISGGGRARAMQFLETAQKLGADLVLPKPVKQQELLAAVSQLLARVKDRKHA